MENIYLLLSPVWHLPRNICIACIKVYQNTLSPDHGPLRHLYTYGYCRHTETCSIYAIRQLQTRGCIVGILYSAWRVLHCTPWKKITDEKILQTMKKL